MKTQLTLDIEKTLYYYSLAQNNVVIEEVGLPNDLGIVDTLALDFKNLDDITWRCYEIKVTKSDFHSKARLSFSGHYNYFVLPLELFEKVKTEIPDKIGVLVYQPFNGVAEIEEDPDAPGFLTTVKKPTRTEPELAVSDFFPFFLNSLQREVTKAKRIEKGPAIYDTDRLYTELKKRMEINALQGKILADLEDSKVVALENENAFLKAQLLANQKRKQETRRHTRPLL